jgi:hypothetical protein
MSILSDFEDRVAKTIEGVFSGAFRSPVQPAELARALSREMEDRRAMGGLADVLAGELAAYLRNHARENAYHLSTKPDVEFVVGEDLKLGRFRVRSEHPETPRVAAAPASAAVEGAGEAGGASLTPDEASLVSDHGTVVSDEAPLSWDADSGGRTVPTVTVGDTGHDVALLGGRMTIGRLADCEIHLDDANASRLHAALVKEGERWVVEDLGSTNGTLLNGRRVERAPLSEGDVITIGLTRLTFNGARD